MNEKKLHKCKVCKEKFSVRGYAEQMAIRLSSVGVCSNCDNWMGYFLNRKSPDVAIAKGQRYTIGPANEQFKGMGGRGVTIKFYDGRIVKTNNLWHQGKVPEIFEQLFPDNATLEASK